MFGSEPGRQLSWIAVGGSLFLVGCLLLPSGVGQANAEPNTQSPFGPAPSAAVAARTEEAGAPTLAIPPAAAHPNSSTADRAPSTSGRPGLVSPAAGVGSPPHPESIRAGGPPGFNGHYYAGGAYSGVRLISPTVAVNLQVPADRPEGGDANFYYVILSVWDNAGSYDQLGFANDYGSWEIAYSTTSYCAGTYYYSPGAFPLHDGLTYSFEMSVSHGFVNFTVVGVGQVIPVWSLTAGTGGSEFLLQRTYSCRSGSYYDYSDYEEVYGTSGPNVPYDLFFTNNSAGGDAVSSWSAFPPGSRPTAFAGTNVTVENEPFSLASGTGPGPLEIPPSAESGPYTWPVSVGALSPTAAVSLSLYHVPHGWTASISPSSGSAPFSASVTFSLPPSVTAGEYRLGVNATNGSAPYGRISLEIFVGREYTVTYVEQGLPTGTPWSAALNDSIVGTTGDSLMILVPNGTYASTISQVPGYVLAAESHGPTVSVAGQNVTAPTLEYSPRTYQVVVQESGLPPGLEWWVNVTGAESVSSNRSTLQFAESNGTWSFSVASACFVADPSTGTLSVEGTNARQQVSFTNGSSPCLDLIAKTVEGSAYGPFNQSFRVPGAVPSIEIVVWSFSGIGAGRDLTPVLPTGISVVSSQGFIGIAAGSPAPGNQTVTWDGAAGAYVIDVAVYAFFNTEGYTFDSGSAINQSTLSLPAGATIYLGVEATENLFGDVTNSSFTIVDVRGTSWAQTPTDLIGRQRSGSFSFDSNQSKVGVAAVGLFPGVPHSISVEESGLPTGAPWSIAVNGRLHAATTSSISFTLFSGSYAYLVTGPAGERVEAVASGLHSTGTLSVGGSPLSVPVEFEKGGTRTVKFHEGGLLAGESWCVDIVLPRCTVATSIQFENLTPGNYSYAVVTPPGYSETVRQHGVVGPGDGTAHLLSSSRSLTVQFRPLLYAVAFAEFGLPSGHGWHLSVACTVPHRNETGCAGMRTSGRTRSDDLLVDLRNGTYVWKVTPIQHYSLVANGTTEWSGTFTVEGGNETIYLSFSRAAAASPGASGGTGPPLAPASPAARVQPATVG